MTANTGMPRVVFLHLALVLGASGIPACDCGTPPPGTDSGEDGGRFTPHRDSGHIEEDAGPQEDDDAGPQQEVDAGRPQDDAGQQQDDAGQQQHDAGQQGDDAGQQGDDAGQQPEDAGDGDGGDDGGFVNGAPVVGSFTSSDSPITAPGSVTLTVAASDPDGDGLSYSYVEVVPNAGIVITPSGDTAVVTFDDTVALGDYQFQVTVSDGNGGTTTATVTVTVNNRAPTIASFTSSDDPLLLPISITLTVGASDPDADALTYTYSEVSVSAPTAGITITPSGTTATVDFTGDVASGEYTFLVQASDGNGGSDTETVKVTVDRHVPVVSSFTTSDDAVTSPASVTLTVVASDADGDTPSYSYAETTAGGPTAGISITPSGDTATVTFDDTVPTGTYELEVTVDDGNGGTTTATVTVTVDNRAPVVSAFTATPSPILPDGANVGSTELAVTASDADGDTLTYSFTEPAGTSGVSIDATTPVAAEEATVTFAATVPRGEYTFEVTVNDGNGGVATASVIVTLSNHHPTANAGVDVSVLPGTAPDFSDGGSVLLAGSGSDPDTVAGDQLDYLWQGLGGAALPAGISFVDATLAQATLLVDRSIYEPDPATVNDTLFLELIVSDDATVQDSDTVVVTLLDERGPYVNNLSGYSGTGPAGYCGTLSHPCDNVADALANLRSLLDAGAAIDPEILVATTGSDYALDAPLTLDADVGIRCAFDPIGWVQSALVADRTPLRFGGAIADGVVIDSGTAAAPILVERCDLQGTAFDAGVTVARALVVQSGAADVVESTVIGNAGAASEVETAIGIDAEAGADRLEASRSDVEGGAARVDVVDARSYGVRTFTDTLLSGNLIVGGQALHVTALWAEDAVAVTSSDDVFIGGDADATGQAVGVAVREGAAFAATTVTITAAAEGTFPAVAHGVRVGAAGSAADLTSSTIASGDATDSALGVSMSTGAGGLTFVGGSITAGAAATSTGVDHALGATLSLAGGATVAGGASEAGSRGVLARCGAGVEGHLLDDVSVTADVATSGQSAALVLSGACDDVAIINSTLAGGDGSSRSVGIHADAANSGLLLQGNTVTTAETTAAAEGIAVDLPQACSSCLLLSNTMRAGTAGAGGTTVGLQMLNLGSLNTHSIVASNVIVGGSGPGSYGLFLRGNATDRLRVLNNTVLGGDGDDSTGIFLAADAVAGTTRVGVFGGNIIDPGTGTNSNVGIFEQCIVRGLGQSDALAEPYVATFDGAFENDFYLAPGGATALVKDFEVPVGVALLTQCDAGTNQNTAAAINGMDGYSSNIVADPDLDVDNVHLLAGSPAIDAAPTSVQRWDDVIGGVAVNNAPHDLLDIDGEPRPVGDNDIGADEVQ